MEITYELQDPIEFVAKKSGDIQRTIESLTLRSPTARVFVDLERRGLLVDGHETEMGFELVKVCGKLDSLAADRLSVSDLEGAMEAMKDAGFFESRLAKMKPKAEPNEEG